jgi:hypothetical protein
MSWSLPIRSSVDSHEIDLDPRASTRNRHDLAGDEPAEWRSESELLARESGKRLG